MNPASIERPANPLDRKEEASFRRTVEKAPTVPSATGRAAGDPSTLARVDAASLRPIMLDPNDDEVRLLIKLGGAVSLLWPELPKSLREKIRGQAACVALPPSFGEPKHLGTHDELNVWLESCRLKHL